MCHAFVEPIVRLAPLTGGAGGGGTPPIPSFLLETMPDVDAVAAAGLEAPADSAVAASPETAPAAARLIHLTERITSCRSFVAAENSYGRADERFL